MKKRFFALVMTLACMMAMTACGATPSSPQPAASSDNSIAPLKITFNIAVSGETFDQMSNTFAERCSELSNGAITVQVVAAGTMGSAREVVEALQLNTVNMIWAADSELDQVVGNMSWAWLPYTVINYDMADEYYNEGWIDEALGEICEGAGIKLVAGAENGFRVCCTNGKKISSADDLVGMKIRVPEQEPLVNFYTLLGCLPSTITASESFAAMQQGAVDGSDNTLFNLNNLGFFDIADTLLMLNYQYSSGKIAANSAWFNALSPEQQEIITTAAKEAGLEFRNTIRAQEDAIVDEISAKGVTVLEPDEAFQTAIREKAASIMWESAYNDYDEQYHVYIDKMIETFS